MYLLPCKEIIRKPNKKPSFQPFSIVSQCTHIFLTAKVELCLGAVIDWKHPPATWQEKQPNESCPELARYTPMNKANHPHPATSRNDGDEVSPSSWLPHISGRCSASQPVWPWSWQASSPWSRRRMGWKLSKNGAGGVGTPKITNVKGKMRINHWLLGCFQANTSCHHPRCRFYSLQV